jgi:hypothetical protein
MHLYKIAAVPVLALSLQGCWFVFIPGSAISAVSDGLTGAEGQNCVSASAKVGDAVSLPGGSRASIKSLSGTSIRCAQPELPIRALLVFDNTVTAARPKKDCALVKDANGEPTLVCP